MLQFLNFNLGSIHFPTKSALLDVPLQSTINLNEIVLTFAIIGCLAFTSLILINTIDIYKERKLARIK